MCQRVDAIHLRMKDLLLRPDMLNLSWYVCQLCPRDEREQTLFHFCYPFIHLVTLLVLASSGKMLYVGRAY